MAAEAGIHLKEIAGSSRLPFRVDSRFRGNDIYNAFAKQYYCGGRISGENFSFRLFPALHMFLNGFDLVAEGDFFIPAVIDVDDRVHARGPHPEGHLVQLLG
jgi:hypothetical protein